MEHDIWNFIKERNIEIADIYYKGAIRTGCVACGFGCQFKDDTRLEILYKLYPKLYNHIMNFTNNGVTYRQAMREMLKVEGMFLPDEDPQLRLNFDYDTE
jgi:3'-phosphoadenosine 5'-phosphosulfate sulfotransferase (PAPS reductase)/FAD synthetase